MIVIENVKFGKINFLKTYSDDDFYIQKKGTNEIYSEAIDLPNMGYTYEETDEKINLY